MSEYTTLTVRSYDWPPANSDLEEAMWAIWRASNIPFTNKVLIDRKHLNALLEFMRRNKPKSEAPDER